MKKPSTELRKKPNLEDQQLKKAVMALGGSDEDYQQLLNVDVDHQPNSKPITKVSEKVLSQEIRDIVKSLGLNQNASEKVSGKKEEKSVVIKEKNKKKNKKKDDTFLPEQKQKSSEAVKSKKDFKAKKNIPDTIASQVSATNGTNKDAIKTSNKSAHQRFTADSDEEMGTMQDVTETLVSVPEINTETQELLDKAKHKLRFQPSPRWFDYMDISQINEDSFKVIKEDLKPVEQLRAELIESTLEMARTLYNEEASAYEQFKTTHSVSELNWIKTITKSGTLTDRVSALSLAIAESPFHTLNHLELLVQMLTKKNRRESMLAVDALCDLALGQSSSGGGLIPSERKLKFFAEQPWLKLVIALRSQDEKVNIWLQDVNGVRKAPKRFREALDLIQKGMMVSYVEDRIKKAFFDLIVAFDQLSHDSVPHIKTKVVSHVWSLLSQKREQERTLLTFLVNKLGDLDRKLPSKTIYLLLQLLVKHPLMKMVVVKEVEQLIRRKGVSDKTQYHALIFLNQIPFSNKKPDILAARYLVNIYFSMFEMLVKSLAASNGSDKDEQGLNGKKSFKKPSTEDSQEKRVETKMLSALLTGLNRAFPFASQPVDTLEKDGAKATEELLSLYQKHIDTLFKLAYLPSLSFLTSTQALLLVYHAFWTPSRKANDQQADSPDADNSVTVFSPKLASRYYRCLYTLMMDPRLFQSTKHIALFMNLMFKSLKTDTDGERSMAMMKRFMQISLSSFQHPATLSASLIVLSEVWKVKQKDEEYKQLESSLRENIEASRAKFAASGLADSDDEEHFVDISEGEEENAKATQLEQAPSKKANKDDDSYDPLTQRSPEFSRASTHSFWELVPFTQHYHPTVALFARTLLYKDGTNKPNSINYPSDPLHDFTLIHFLDRFVYKNPKKLERDGVTGKLMPVKAVGGDSIMKPKVYSSSFLRRPLPLDRTLEKPINLNQWQKKKDDTNVPVDERFYVPFFRQTEKKVAKNSEEEDNDEMDDDQEIDDDLALEAIMRTVPGDKNDLIGGGVSEDEDDMVDDAEFARMMEEADSMMKSDHEDSNSEGSQTAVIETLEEEVKDLSSEEEDNNAIEMSDEDDAFWQDDSDPEDIEAEDEVALQGDDGDGDDKRRQRKKRNEQVRDRLQQRSKKKSFNVNAVAAAAPVTKDVFASVDAFAHLLNDPDHNDVWWSQHPEAEQQEVGSRAFKKRSASRPAAFKKDKRQKRQHQ